MSGETHTDKQRAAIEDLWRYLNHWRVPFESPAYPLYAKATQAMEVLSVKTPPGLETVPEGTSQAALDVIAERDRQIKSEGWTSAHDDSYSAGQMAIAASCYAAHAFLPDMKPPALWPWHKLWWKPKDPRRNLIRAAALIIAEVEKLDRAILTRHRATKKQGLDMGDLFADHDTGGYRQ